MKSIGVIRKKSIQLSDIYICGEVYNASPHILIKVFIRISCTIIYLTCLEAAETGDFDKLADKEGFGVSLEEYYRRADLMFKIVEQGGEGGEDMGWRSCDRCRRAALISLRTVIKRWENKQKEEKSKGGEGTLDRLLLEKESDNFELEAKVAKMEKEAEREKKEKDKLKDQLLAERLEKEKLLAGQEEAKKHLDKIEARLKELERRDRLAIFKGEVKFSRGVVHDGDEMADSVFEEDHDMGMEECSSVSDQGSKEGGAVGEGDTFSNSGKRRPSWLTDGFECVQPPVKRVRIYKEKRVMEGGRHVLDASGGELRSVIQRYKPLESEGGPLFADPAYAESDHSRLWQNCHFSKADLDLGVPFDFSISLRVKQGGGRE